MHVQELTDVKIPAFACPELPAGNAALALAAVPEEHAPIHWADEELAANCK
jgi:hypothetical protein